MTLKWPRKTPPILHLPSATAQADLVKKIECELKQYEARLSWRE
jgi:hypothetical protein